MSDTFDPYHKWLGIPPAEQPPSHYRLLGIAAFESDADVIDAAANQRVAYLQDMAVGPQVEHSQKLLNEVSAARRCLLNLEVKQAYDAELRAKQAAQEAARQPAVDASFVPIINTDAPSVASSGRPAAKKKPKPTSKAEQPDAEAAEGETARKLSPAMLASFASVGVLSLVIALFLIFGGNGGEQPQSIGGKSGVAGSGTFKVLWKLDEREAALMMIDGKDVFDSQKTHPDKTETLSFSVTPGQHDFYFEREGYRAIRYSYKFLPGESNRIELKWRRR